MSNQMSKLFLIAIILLYILACSIFPQTGLENSIPITSVQLSELDPDSYVKIGLGRVFNTKYSPDNKILAVATSTGVLLYDTTTYELIKHFPDSFVDNLEWSPDGSKLTYSSSYEIKLIDLQGEKTTSLEKQRTWLIGDEMSWSPDGKMLATIDSTDNNGAIYVWDSATGNLIQRITYPEKRVFGRYAHSEGVAWSPDGSYLAVAYSFVNLGAPDKPSDIVIWDVSNETALNYNHWLLPDDYDLLVMEGLEWTPNRKYLVLGGAFVTVYDAENGTLISTLDTQVANRFSLSPDGNILFLAGQENGISVISYDVPSLEKIKEYHGRIESPESIDVSHDGKSIVASDSFFDGFEIWDSQSREIINTTLLGSHWNDDVRFSPDGKYFAALGRDNNIRLYNTDDFKLETEIKGGNVLSLDTELNWSDDSERIAWAGENTNGADIWQIWNKTTGEKNIINDNRTSFALETLHSAKRTTRGNNDKYQVWSLEQNGEYELTAEIKRDPNYSILCSSWSPDYEKLAVCFTDLIKDESKLIVFNPELKPLVQVEERVIERFDEPVWSPNGKWLASIDEYRCKKVLCTGNDYFLNIRSSDTMELVFSYKVELSKSLITWSPDSRWLITTGSPEQYGLTIYPISIEGSPLQIIEETGTIEGIDWSQNGEHIVLNGYNGVIYLYSAEKILEKYFPPQK